MHNSCTRGELLEIAQKYYDIDKKIEMVELTYPLSDLMLQQMTLDTLLMHVANDR